MDLAADLATIVAPDGSLAQKPTVYLTPEDAKIVRAYERWLKVNRLYRPEGVGVYCSDCWEANRSDGTRYFIEPGQILIECRCKVRTFSGTTL